MTQSSLTETQKAILSELATLNQEAEHKLQEMNDFANAIAAKYQKSLSQKQQK